MMEFATAAIALYAAHHVGDYWVQLDEDAQHKGDAGLRGRLHCLRHVLTYTLTQAVFLGLVTLVIGDRPAIRSVALALLISGVTHWMADRREHGLMFWLARRIPGKAAFLELGKPRPGVSIEIWDECPTCEGTGFSGDQAVPGGKCWDCRGGGELPARIGDNPSLGTGAWALDQAWHIFWGVFVAALVIAL